MKQIDSAEKLLEEVLSIPSVNGIDSTYPIANFIAEYLEAAGIQTTIQRVSETQANVIAIIEGESQTKVVWNGHLDTVPYGELSKWKTNPEIAVKENKRYYARGASDMKGGLAAMAYVLAEQSKQNNHPKNTIIFIGTCDEEKGGLGAHKVVEAGYMKDVEFVLIGEPTGCNLGIAQKGCIWLQANITGATSHGAYPNEGVNALSYGWKIFEDIRKRFDAYTHDFLGKPTIQVTMASGGIAPNMTPDKAELLMDIRTIPGITAQEILRWAQESVEECQVETHKKLSVEFQVGNDRMAIETSPDSPWLQGLTGNFVGINYFTDASIMVKEKQIPVLLLGPGEAELAHQPNEYIEIEKYLQYIEILRKFYIQ